MRRRTALVLLLGTALVGCGGGDDGKPIDPSLSQVTIKVDGMT